MTEEKRKFYNSKRTEGLTPELQEILTEGIEELEKDGFRPYVTQGYRSPEEQDALYLQGRRPLEVVNEARKKVGLDPISLAENERIVTKARGGQSKHNLAKAFDIVNIEEDGEINWEDMHFYRAAALVFEKLGASWGGDWNFADFPHFEID